MPAARLPAQDTAYSGRSTRWKPSWGEGKLGVTFQSNHPFYAIKELSFIRSDGKDIKTEFGGSGVSAGNYAQRASYLMGYDLAEKVSQATIRVTYFATEKATVPVRATAGVGL